MRNCCAELYLLSLIYGNCANQSSMTLALVRCSIEADQGLRGTLYARARVSLVSWEGGSHVVFFMVLLGLLGARPMGQALWLQFEYYLLQRLLNRIPQQILFQYI